MDSNKEFTITGIKNVQAGRPDGTPEPVWMVEMSTDGGETPTHAVAFPHCTLGWRVAEYGIDPADVETLIDVALHEPHMQIDHTDPTFLYNTDQATARESLLNRVANVKKSVTHSDPQGHLDQIRRAYDPNDPATEGRRAQVEHNRAGTATEMRSRPTGN